MLSNIPRVYWATAIIVAVFAFYIFANLQRNRDPDRPVVTFRDFFAARSFEAYVFKDRSKDPNRPAESLREFFFPRFFANRDAIPVSRFAGVGELRRISVDSKELIAEVYELIDQRGLPADVFRGLSDDVSNISGLSEEEWLREWQRLRHNNIALTLNSFFGEFYVAESAESTRPRSNDMETLWDASPIGAWDVNADVLDSVRPILTRLDPRRQSLRNQIRSPDTRFYYIFISPADSEIEVTVRGRTVTATRYISEGTRVNTGASRYLADYALLEEYAIAQALLDGNIEEATAALAFIFRIAHLASRLKDIGVRADAARVRLRAFDVMQRVVLDPQFERRHMIFLRDMLSDQYHDWTPERDAWFGDRADGLMVYQRAIRNGLESAFDTLELQELFNRGIGLAVAEQGFRKYRDEDMVFYLRAMQQILDASGKTLMERLDVLDQIDLDLADKQDIFDSAGVAMEPFVAGIRLQSVEHFMVLFAQDQSALNRALVAIHHSLGQTNTNHYLDPFTDEPYEVQRDDDGFISVSATRLPRPFRVPVF